jgi:ATPase subunit of ABC transporter with duplicated ATPase domains
VSTKLPDDAFEQYLGMGPTRSYQELAKKLGVDKRTIVRRAAEGKWTERLARIQRQADDATDARLADEARAMRDRHLKEARFVQAQALKAMQTLPPEKAVRAAQALAIGWRQEMLLLGDPTERSEAITTQEIVRREYELWLKKNNKPCPNCAEK